MDKEAVKQVLDELRQHLDNGNNAVILTAPAVRAIISGLEIVTDLQPRYLVKNLCDPSKGCFLFQDATVARSSANFHQLSESQPDPKNFEVLAAYVEAKICKNNKSELPAKV